jgi:pimeloyl-ACP methyl ester carboxylesterase
LKSFYLAGNGLGGQIAWFYTADHPEKIKKLVLLDALGYPNESMRSIGNWFVRTPFLGEIAEKITPRTLFRNHLEALWANDALLTDSIVERDFQLFLREGNRAAWADRIRVEDNRPPIDFIKKIAVPTFIIWGAEDTAVPTGHAYLFHKDIHKSILKIYEGVGHLPQEEAAELTARDVRLFLEGKF